MVNSTIQNRKLNYPDFEPHPETYDPNFCRLFWFLHPFSCYCSLLMSKQKSLSSKQFHNIIHACACCLLPGHPGHMIPKEGRIAILRLSTGCVPRKSMYLQIDMLEFIHGRIRYITQEIQEGLKTIYY